MFPFDFIDYFRKIKCIKTRLRSTLYDSYLKFFMLEAVEKTILYDIDIRDIIKSKNFLTKTILNY